MYILHNTSWVANPAKNGESKMHNCPRCGQLTSGSWSEGGLKWAICDDCMNADRLETESHPTPVAADGCTTGCFINTQVGGHHNHCNASATAAEHLS